MRIFTCVVPRRTKCASRNSECLVNFLLCETNVIYELKFHNILYSTSYSWKEDRFSSLMRPESFYVPESLILHTTMVPWYTLVVGLLSTVSRCNCNFKFTILTLAQRQLQSFFQFRYEEMKCRDNLAVAAVLSVIRHLQQ